ncbi:MAG TPA: cellulase family glycosylhydrolase [Terracidiphilus sp.]|nr:cellulase family glycosylhydrolase [Terracidiphilus sp.]
MNRRHFLSGGASAALAASCASGRNLTQAAFAATGSAETGLSKMGKAVGHHRFGVNYTPSHNWWFCWNDWNVDPIRHDLDAIAALGADHLRLMLIWPYFQPNLTWVSRAHLERLSQLLALMAERNLDALITVFTGQLSGWYFLPPFNKPDPALFIDPDIWKAQELLIHALARTMSLHHNIIGFDFGNEMNTCWHAETAVGDAWMAKMFRLMNAAYPGGIHVNGVDHHPWFEPATFSARALAANPFPVIHAYPYWSEALKYGGPMDPPSTHILSAFAALVRSYAGDAKKPVWAGEFNTCIESMSEKQQAQWLETAVTSAIESGVSWFSYWDSHDVDRKFAFNSLEYSLGLLTNDGKVKEQGRVFKQLASAYRGKLVKFPTVAPPPPPPVQNFDQTWKWLLNFLEWKPKDTGA